MKILLVDDHVLFREGLSNLLSAQPDMTIVGSADTVTMAIACATELKPDLVLMDFILPDGTGLEATRAILKEHPDCVIVFLTIHEEDERLFEAIYSGAKGYLLKNVSVTKLLDFLRGVLKGEAAITRTMASKLLDRFAEIGPQTRLVSATAVNKLTNREMEILHQLDTGATNREIAHRLSISERTVKNHVSNILAKLELANRQQAVHYARHHGILG
ncbi:MAG: response regulator transcription factor [Ardenticatenaceae bacterium]|nr:response regulator transcription factor [Ardenticatenaceae bacterium]